MTAGSIRWLSRFASAAIAFRRWRKSYPRLDISRLSARDLADLNLTEDFAAKLRRHSMFHHID